MKLWVKVLLGIVGTIVVVVSIGAVIILNPPTALPSGEHSTALYAPGTLGVVEMPFEVVDTTRPTAPNGEFPGAPERTLKGKLWLPADTSAAPFPLIVYSHGFMSSIAEAQYLVDFLVPKGYAIVAVNYPLSGGGAPGGPNVRDVANQPEDVSAVIDEILKRDDIDPDRIGIAGLSLGGLTTILTGFHRDLRDPRVKAIAAIAGPSAFFNHDFFTTTDAPFMMVAGTLDAIVPYPYHAATIPERADGAILVSLDRGTHVGFASGAAMMFRFFDHPDEPICPNLVANLNREDAPPDAPLFAPDDEIGIIAADPDSAPCRNDKFEYAMRPGPQQMLTRLAIYAFFESVFAEDANTREEMSHYLLNELSAENPDARVTTSSSGHT